LKPQLLLEQSSTDPLDEQFQSATLNSVVITAQILVLNITVYSMADIPINVKLPLTFSL
jgi:hypothetical protein